jgi:hypothetical protein
VQTQCRQPSFAFQALGSRSVVAAFDGGAITSDAGLLLLRELEDKRRILRVFASAFRDHRDPARIEHSVEHLLAQRVFALCCGYEDLNDHDFLAADPVLATAAGKSDPTGQTRRRERDRGKAGASRSTLNRLELRSGDPNKDGVYKKIEACGDALDEAFVRVFLSAHREAPEVITLDLDATDDRIHGNQEGRFFHGYYGDYCYLPLYIFSDDFLLCARLRRSNIDASAGAKDEVARIVSQIRERFPKVIIVLRADSGFAREELMAWCESQADVHYLFGLAKNTRLLSEIEAELAEAEAESAASGTPVRRFKELRYRTLDSWSCERRVVAKAEHLEKGANPRFVVTSIAASEIEARELYEEIYCARGEMENRIKETQLDLFSDRTSAQTMKANQVRLWLSSMAYVVMNEIRRVGLSGTAFEEWTCGSIRLKLVKIGARVRVSVRRVAVSMASSYPYQALFAHVYDRVRHLEPVPV